MHVQTQNWIVSVFAGKIMLLQGDDALYTNSDSCQAEKATKGMNTTCLAMPPFFGSLSFILRNAQAVFMPFL
jgi:hypothetical protein